MVKRRGPNTELWGTPWLTGARVEPEYLMVTNLLEKYDWKQERVVPVRPRYSEKWLRRMVWQTVSKAAERSRRMRILLWPV